MDLTNAQQLIEAHKMSESKGSIPTVTKKRVISSKNQPIHYACLDCSFESVRKSDLKRHARQSHPKPRHHPCKHCDFRTPDWFELHQHLIDAHQIVHRFQCEECGRSVKEPRTLRTHMEQVHLKIRSEKCPLCGFRASSRSLVNAHVRKTHSEHVVRLGIPTKATIKSQVELTLGPLSRASTQMGDNSFKCPKCDVVKKKMNALKNHYQAVHEERLDFVCEQCGKRFLIETRLNVHIKRVHKKIKEFKCEYCGHSTDTQCRMKLHINSVHLKAKPFVCDQCKFSAGTSQALRIHVESVHLKIKNVACPYCNYKTYQYSILRSHAKRRHADHDPHGICQVANGQNNVMVLINQEINKELAALIKIPKADEVNPPSRLEQDRLKKVEATKTFDPEDFRPVGFHPDPENSMDEDLRLTTESKFDRWNGLEDLCDDLYFEEDSPLKSAYLNFKDEEYLKNDPIIEPVVPINKADALHQGVKHEFDLLDAQSLRPSSPDSQHEGNSPVPCNSRNFMLEELKLKDIHPKRTKGRPRKNSTKCDPKQLTQMNPSCQAPISSINNAKVYYCDQCSFSTKLSSSLYNHLKNVHRNERKFVCDQCGKRFNSVANLKVHVDWVHEKLRPYSCHLCSHATSTGHKLQLHIKSVHDKIRPFSCQLCSFTATEHRNVKIHHVQVHLKLKDFACTLCTYKTGLNCILNQHYRSKHKLQPPFPQTMPLGSS